MAMTPEARVKAQVKKLLESKGVYFFMPVSNGMGRHGIPDVIACWDGKFLGVEVKAPGKRANTSALQDREINAIRLAKGLAIVVDDVSQLEELLEGG
jgi:Holliday junction resolvase